MIKGALRDVVRRALPLILAALLAVAAGTRVTPPGDGRPAATAARPHGTPADEPANDSPADEPATTDPVAGRERVLTAQTTAAAGVSRAPPATAA